MTTDARDRLGHATEVLSALFPGGTIRETGRRHRSTVDPRRDFGVAPTSSHPRLLLPAGPRSAGAAALRVYGGRLQRRGRWGYAAAAAGLRVAGGGVLPKRFVVDATDARGVDDAIGERIGRQVAVGVHLTPARANRKPVLPVLSAGERVPIAFAKAALTPLARELVQHEDAALRELQTSDLAGMSVPRSLGVIEVGDVPVLLLSPLPTWSRGRLPTHDEMCDAALALARSGSRTSGSVRATSYWAKLVGNAATIETPAAEMIKLVLDAVDTAVVGVDLEFGCGHGDWSPWNLWQTAAGLLVWDWERYADDVPVGVDIVHYTLQELIVTKGMSPRTAADQVLARAPSILQRVLTDPAAARAVALLHLTSLAVRYEKDGQAAAGMTLGDTTTWLLPAIRATAESGVRT